MASNLQVCVVKDFPGIFHLFPTKILPFASLMLSESSHLAGNGIAIVIIRSYSSSALRLKVFAYSTTVCQGLSIVAIFYEVRIDTDIGHVHLHSC